VVEIEAAQEILISLPEPLCWLASAPGNYFISSRYAKAGVFKLRLTDSPCDAESSHTIRFSARPSSVTTIFSSSNVSFLLVFGLVFYRGFCIFGFSCGLWLNLHN